MFEQYADEFWLGLFIALVLYGLSNVIRVPLVVKRFYAGLNFKDNGPVVFDVEPFAQSRLLQGLMTRHHYRGDYGGCRVEQFAACSTERRKFTLNKTLRKRNQKIWTVTVVVLEESPGEFCARPLLVAEAPEYVLNNDAVLFPDDEAFSRRIHVVAEDHAQARKLINAQVRDYLNGTDPDPLALELVQNRLIHRRLRQPHDTGRVLQKDLDAVVQLANALRQESER